jgi:hypothetical protein
MKKIKILYIFIALLSVTLTGCDENDTAEVSSITSYPVFVMEGDEISSIVSSGSAYVDPGVTATENGEDIEVTVSGSVNPSVPGVYTLTYSASNSDGFNGNVTRTVVVTAEDVSGTDLSGDYKRNNVATNPTNTVTRLASGYYQASNGSGDGNNLAHRFVHTGGTSLLVPVQQSRFGRVQGTGTITAVGYTISLQLLDPPNAGLTLNRSFTKQ